MLNLKNCEHRTSECHFSPISPHLDQDALTTPLPRLEGSHVTTLKLGSRWRCEEGSRQVLLAEADQRLMEEEVDKCLTQTDPSLRAYQARAASLLLPLCLAKSQCSRAEWSATWGRQELTNYGHAEVSQARESQEERDGGWTLMVTEEEKGNFRAYG